MGTFRVLNANLPCRRCGFVRPVGIQFKTGDDRAMPEYEVDDVAADAAPDVYDGIADAYCARCQTRWTDDEKRIGFELLSDDVAAGRVTARRATWRHGALDGRPELGLVITLISGPMTAADVLALAERPAGAFWESFTARLMDVALWAADLRLHPHDDDWQRVGMWWSKRNDEVGLRLHALGWPHGDDHWIDVPVLVDTDHRVRLAP